MFDKLKARILAGVFLASACGLHQANAEEKFSPLQLGVTTGTPVAAVPPPGFYFGYDVALNPGMLVNGDGDKAVTPGGQTIRVFNIINTPSLFWSPGWHILGATYGALINQPYMWENTYVHGQAGGKVSSHGIFNTIVTPVILSWMVAPGIFVGGGFTVYLKDGNYDSATNPVTMQKQESSKSYANNFYTFEPNFAFSYLRDGWNITLNSLLDFNTKNTDTSYHSGSIYYLDATATKSFGPLSAGLVGNYTQQIQNDSQFGHTVGAIPGLHSRGDRAQHLLLGPSVAYDFGKFTLSARYLQNLHTRNDQAVSFFHFVVTVPFR